MRKILGPLLVVLLLAPAPAMASATGALAGRILAVDGAPQARTVWLAGADGGSPPSPVPVAADGSFLAEGIPAGPVSLAVETSAGLYTVETPVAIAPGATRTVSLALRGRQETPPAPPTEEQKKKKGAGFWSNPLYASLVVIGGAIVVGLIIDSATKSDSNPTASPSTTAD